ncbi:MAG: hypothetical protein JWN35_2764 [Frankiales bacterium]|nr:hypothetical protein [Frankiales bacterium]
MPPVRLPRRLLFLVIAVLAVISPTVHGAGAGSASFPTASSVTRLVGPTVTGAVRTSPGAVRTQDKHRPVQPAASAGSVSADSTPAGNAPLRPPVLLLVERPRPPTATCATSAVGAPTGRSPPAPTGT